MSIEAMRLALDALKAADKGIIPGGIGSDERNLMKQAITALRQAIQEAALQQLTDIHQEMEQKPVAWWNPDESGLAFQKLRGDWHPLYAAPPKAEKQEPVPESNSYSVKRARDVVKALEKRNRKSWDELDREAVFAIHALVAAFEFQFYRANSAPAHAIDTSEKRVDETAKDKHEPDVYGDGNVYRGQRSKDSETKTLHYKADKQEPVAFLMDGELFTIAEYEVIAEQGDGAQPLYTAPPKREWVGLTYEEVSKSVDMCEQNIKGEFLVEFARAIEAKLKEKNT